MFGAAALGSCARRHCPMHGPQAFASTVAPIASSARSWPSRSIVARTCSEPGVTSNALAARDAVARGLRARRRRRGSCPRTTSWCSFRSAPRRCVAGKPFARSRDLGRELRERARAVGRVRADDVRLERREVEREHAVVVASRGSPRPPGRARAASPCFATTSAERAAPGRAQVAAMRSSAGNIEVVAPSSAPMFAIVALPVALSVRAPGPMYSTIALVPPDTLSWPATHRITSLGAVQPPSSPVRTPRCAAGSSSLPGQAGDHLDRVRAAHADRAGAEAAGVRRVRVGAEDQRAGKRVVLEHHLVDDARARAPRSRRRTSPPPSAGSRRPRGSRRASRAGRRRASTRAWIRWSQWIEVGTATRARPVCMNCSIAVWPSTSWNTTRSGRRESVARAGLELARARVVEVSEQDLVRQRERPRAGGRRTARQVAFDRRRALGSPVSGVASMSMAPSLQNRRPIRKMNLSRPIDAENA